MTRRSQRHTTVIDIPYCARSTLRSDLGLTPRARSLCAQRTGHIERCEFGPPTEAKAKCSRSRPVSSQRLRGAIVRMGRGRWNAMLGDDGTEKGRLYCLNGGQRLKTTDHVLDRHRHRGVDLRSLPARQPAEGSWQGDSPPKTALSAVVLPRLGSAWLRLDC